MHEKPQKSDFQSNPLVAVHPIDDRPERALRIGRAFRVGRRAWHPFGDGHPSFPLAALMQNDVQIKTGTPMRSAHFHGRSLSFGQKPHFEPRLTKSEVRLKL